MTPDEQIVQLERELMQTRTAAVSLITGLANGFARTDRSRQDIARMFHSVANDQETDEVTARLARLAAEAIEREGGQAEWLRWRGSDDARRTNRPA